MSQIQKNHFYSKQLQKVISFFKYSNAKYLNILYIIVFCIPAFLIVFQNCKMFTDELLPEEHIKSPEDNPKNKPVPNPVNINYERGFIIQINPENGDFIESQPLPIDSDITFKLLNIDPKSDNYKWTIKRGFESIVTDASTQTGTYSIKFSELGSYDVFANSYEATEPKTRASKKFVVGESCSLTDILEIELLPETSASFKVGESGYSTFGLKDSSNFSSINWKATLPSGQVVENEESVDTLEVDLSAESDGLLVIEVSATSSDVSRSGCLTYRRKEVIVTSNVRPYFNPINFTDGRDSIPVILENDIYKYEKPDTLFFQIEILNADSCQYQINEESKIDFNCDNELIEFLSNLGTDCINGVVTLFASYNREDVDSQSYYHYCPADGNYCYFGTVSERQSHHVCPVASPVSGSCGSSKGICQTGQPRGTQDTETHYQWQCVGSGGGTTENCQEAKITNTKIPSCPSGQYTSSSGCNTANPSNSTCQSQGNRCYGWSCDSGYTQSGNSCTRSCPSGQYTSLSGCDSANPSNSTCQSQGNRCYGWSCDSGYTQSGNSCTRSCPSGQYTSSSGCNTANPSNSTCSSQGNGCYGWSCDNSYTKVGSSCVRFCPKGQYNSQTACDSANPTNSICSPQGNRCYSWSCDSGYKKSGNSCVRSRLSITITHLRTPTNRKGEAVGNCQSDSRYNACIFDHNNGSTNNYGVNILDTINTFLENNSYKVLIDGQERATLVSGKWTRPYGSDSDPDFKTSQANIYHWLMYQKEWMKLNANTWYASNKDIKAKIEDISYPGSGAWYYSANKMSFNKTPRRENFFTTILHEGGHANLYYAKGRPVRRENYTRCISRSNKSDICCNTYKGCFHGINEGQAEFHEYLIDNTTSRISSSKESRCNPGITLTSKAEDIYKKCDKRHSKGQRHTIGFLVYTTIWIQIYNHPNVNKKYIAVLFSEHLPLLEGNDDFVTAGVKIVNLAQQIFDESTGARYAEIIRTIFRDRGLPLN